MARSNRELQEINAGSMADIAFLLLIFFLVTTTMDVDTGIARKLPPMPEDKQIEDDSQIHARNIYVVLVNSNNQLLVEGVPMDISQLKDGAKDFIDNNGLNPELSDNPEKAIISLQNDRLTEYGTYIAVQNELVAAYNQLRNREAQRLYGRDFTEMNDTYLDPKTSDAIKDDLKPKLERIQKMYPQKLSEAEPKNN